MAELGNARDLKFVAPFEIHRIFCITLPETETKIDAKRRDLHKATGPSRHARRAPAPVSVTLHFSPALPSGVDRETQFVAISLRRSRRERLAAAFGSFDARVLAGGWVSSRRFESVVRYVATTTVGVLFSFRRAA